MKSIVTGLDHLLADPPRFLKGKRIGLLVNQTSLAADGQHAVFHVHRHPNVDLKRLFAPEHGIRGVDQDMEAVENSRDALSGVEVTSLYGSEADSLEPDPAALAGLDALVFDIQDIGSRYYTFIYTLANCMRACGKVGLPVVVCDRPNPINGVQVEGNRVGENCRSFVGQFPIANRHGMTVAELARMFNDHFGIGCDLTVAPLSGWKRSMWFDGTGLLWVAPSPNMPRLDTATVYPGMCLVEGTRLSEGRGTTQPFELCGAPGIDPRRLADFLAGENLPGVFFRPVYFQPTFQKFAGEPCGGIQIHVIRRDEFQPVLTGIAVIRAIARLFPGDFRWRPEPYEFVSDRPAIDLLFGNSGLREQFIPDGVPLREIEESWRRDLEEFKRLRQQYLLY